MPVCARDDRPCRWVDIDLLNFGFLNAGGCWKKAKGSFVACCNWEMEAPLCYLCKMRASDRCLRLGRCHAVLVSNVWFGVAKKIIRKSNKNQRLLYRCASSIVVESRKVTPAGEALGVQKLRHPFLGSCSQHPTTYVAGMDWFSLGNAVLRILQRFLGMTCPSNDPHTSEL